MPVVGAAQLITQHSVSAQRISGRKKKPTARNAEFPTNFALPLGRDLFRRVDGDVAEWSKALPC